MSDLTYYARECEYCDWEGEREDLDVRGCPQCGRLTQPISQRVEIARLKRILAVERGDESQAPEGWRFVSAEVSETPTWVRQPLTVWHGPQLDADPWVWWWALGMTEGTAAPSALEAMEAADAALESSS